MIADRAPIIIQLRLPTDDTVIVGRNVYFGLSLPRRI
jgi:hypothetical protein